MKKKLRSLLCLVLALSMALSLAACGDKENGEDSHPEMVYVAESLSLDSPAMQEGITPAAFTEDGFYGLSYGKVGTEIPEGSTPLYAGEFDVYANRIFFIGRDGSTRELTGYRRMDAVPNTENKTAFSSSSDIAQMYVNNNGELVVVESRYVRWFEGTEEERHLDNEQTWEMYRYSSDFYFRVLNDDGSEKSCVKIDFDTQNTWLDFSGACFDENGNLLAIGDQTIYAFAPDGSLSYRINCMDWPESLLKMKDGTIAVFAWGEQGPGLFPLDMEKKTLGDPIAIPENANNLMLGDDNYDFYYLNGMYLYAYRIDTQEEVKVLNWMDVDINGDRLSGMHIYPNGDILCIINYWSEDGVDTELVTVRQVPYDSVPQKQGLTMAVMYYYDVYDQVIEFNRHNDAVRIQIIDYSEYNDYESGDFDAGRTKLLTEIMSGQVPDIIAMGELPYTQLAARGILEDLYPFIDNDPELKREDFFPNVLQALEVDGHLYQIAPYFNVQTLIGATSVVGDKPGWTYQDLQAALATMPEGCEPLDMYTTRGDLLMTLLYTDLDHYVDWTTGECYFDSPDFIEMLEFTAQFPESIPDDMEWVDTSTRIAQGRQMLTTASLYSVDSMLWNDVQFGEQGCTYIGYPTNNGVGSYMNIGSGYAISSSCKNKEAAWQFIRSFLTKEGQENAWGGIPLRVDAYQAQLEQAMTPDYVLDENGDFKLDENGEKIQLPRGSYTTEDGTEHYVYAMTQEQADKLWEAVTTCTKVVDYDTAIYEIVLEEAKAYYAGKKSAEEVARLIQSKATLYVNERR